MIPQSVTETGPDQLAEPVPAQVTSSAERLHRMAALDGWRLGNTGRRLLEDLMAAAASAEQVIADQQARIRYLEGLTNCDELTALLNRRGFTAELSRAIARAKRSDETGLLVLCDLDHFKAINDSYGHPAGDAVLAAVGHFLRKRVRQNDAVARLGGDEFAVLVADSNVKKGGLLAEKLYQGLNRIVVPWRGIEIPVSASVGYAVYDRNSRESALFAAADRALYRDKRRHLAAS